MNLKKTKTIFERPKELNPLVLGWGFVCRAGSQVPILGLKIKKLLLSHLGSLFIILALAGSTVMWGPLAFFETRYRVIKLIDQHKKVKISYFGQLVEKQIDRSIQIAPDAYFSIVIPKIGAKAKVIPNVDPSNQEEYGAALKEGVAHAKGTFFPGMKGNITLFAHSTDAPVNIARFNAVFYLLRELAEGDVVYVYFRGAKRTYRVYKKETLTASAVDSFKQQAGEEVLILQTCWPPGTSLQRILVYAKPV